MRARGWTLYAITAGAVLAGCGGGGVSSTSIPATAAPTPRGGTTAAPTMPTPSPAPSPLALQRGMIVAATQGGVLFFPPGASGNASPIATIPERAQQVALDARNDLFVRDNSSTIIHEYAPGAFAAPLHTFDVFVGAQPTPVAFASDAQGGLYVLYSGGSFPGSGSVAFFAPGSTAPSATVGLAMRSVSAIAVDASNDVFIAGSENDGGPTVVELVGGVSGAATRLSGYSGMPYALAVDGSGALYAFTERPISATSIVAAIDRIAPPFGAQPAPSPGLSPPPQVTEIAGPSTRLDAPQSLAVGPDGTIYAGTYTSTDGNVASIIAFPPGSSGNVAPSAVLSGPQLGSAVTGLAIVR